MADATKAEQEAWLLEPDRIPREILLFNRFTSHYTDIHALSGQTLTIRLSEIAEQSTHRVISLTRWLVALTLALLVLTLVLAVFTIRLYQDAHADAQHRSLSDHAQLQRP